MSSPQESIPMKCQAQFLVCFEKPRQFQGKQQQQQKNKKQNKTKKNNNKTAIQKEEENKKLTHTYTF